MLSSSVPETSSSLHFCVLPLNSDQIIKSHFPQSGSKYLKECQMWAGEAAHWVEVLAAMLGDLRVIPATHRVKGKNRFQPSCPLTFTGTLLYKYKTHVHREINTQREVGGAGQCQLFPASPCCLSMGDAHKCSWNELQYHIPPPAPMKMKLQ